MVSREEKEELKIRVIEQFLYRNRLGRFLYRTGLTLYGDWRLPYVGEAAILEKIRAMFDRGFFVDIGAQIGHYSVNLANCFDEVWAVEPYPPNITALKKNIAKFDIKNIKVFDIALSDKEGTATLHSNSNSITGFAGLKKIYKRIPGTTVLEKGGMRVNTSTLAELIGERKADLVKVDVEGAEWEVLQGAKSVLPHIGMWIIETHNEEQDRKIREFLKQHGYKINRLYCYNLGLYIMAQRMGDEW